jgi:4-amino-4-deoxy-L-arabinose transferase-like glycosyltransferase
VQLALFALWLLCTLGLRPLSLPDEGRYAEVAREMLAGDALVPTLNGLPFFHKPPLLYWIDAAAMRVVGVTPLAARIGPMLGAWVMGAALYFAMRRWHGARAATTALIVCASCPLLFLSGQYVNHDMLVGGLIAAAVLAFARAVDAPSADAPVSRRWTLAGWALCALAVLAKGLIGIVLPALVIAPWLAARGRWRQLLALLHPSGPAVFALLAVPWFVAMQSRHPGFADYFFMEQHVRRFALAGFNNAQPFWFFVAALPAATLPWTAWLPAALRRARRAADATGALYVWWVVAVVGFFSLPSSKLLGYVLPALAPWCALLALAVADAPAGARAPRWAAALGIAICLGVVGGLAWKTPKSNRAAALALAERIGDADRVVMVDDYFADLAFYARAPHPAIVASDWDDPALPRHDNWRKELYDAARFDPARGRELLRPLAALDALACGHGGATWFAAQPAQSGRVAAVPGAQRVHADANGELWRVPPRACGEG